ncbi:MAG: leucyl aminopeptidase [Alphaproteobacteria bacterium]|nr:leucyl aminopeptidase [Alphaproteobacteria bacterium]
MKITFSSSVSTQADAVVVGVYKDCVFTPAAESLNNKIDGALRTAMNANHFKGEDGQVLQLNAIKGGDANRILVVGLGEKGQATEASLNALGGKISSTLRATPDASVEVRLDGVEGKGLSCSYVAACVAAGLNLKSWRFDKYQTKLPEDKKPKLSSAVFVTDTAAEATKLYEPMACVAEGVFFSRELISEPANIIYPETLAQQAATLKAHGVSVEIMGEAEMKKLGMGALLGVGQGSVRESQMVIMQWNGGAPSDQPLAFIGKGVTFDTGGISLKPGAGMEEMKFDMGGAGVVIGLMKSLALRKAKVNVIGAIGLVENMPDGNAQRPGDVVTSMSGQTIEVLNTDAEGRLVLADVLWYTQDRFKPKFMINLATLTGAIIVALGYEYAGLFSNNDELSERLMKTGEIIDEKLCRLPLHKTYDRDIDSDVADMANQQKTPRAAGSIAAAQFLHRFVNGTPWAHLDIAGTAWTGKEGPVWEKGATAYGVRLLDRLVTDYYETK